MQSRHRLAGVAYFADLSLYLVMTALPFRVLSLGGGSLILGLVPALYAAPYALLVFFAGRRSDRGLRETGIRRGVLIASAGALLLSVPGSLPLLLLSIPVLSVGLSMVWPAVQAACSELDPERGLSRGVRLFNLSWSAGKGTGFLVGGVILSALGPSRLTLLAALTYFVAWLLVPALVRPSVHHVRAEGTEPLPSPQLRRAFRNAAWLANGLIFGVGATVNHHYPRILQEQGAGGSLFGATLGLIYLAQTTSFVLFSATARWHYRLGALVLAQWAVALMALLLPALGEPVAVLALTPLLGLSMGFAYQSSLYYSLHAPEERGRWAGIHEASLGIASAGLPLAGGAVAEALGRSQAPFEVAAVTLLGSSLFAWATIARSGRNGRHS